MSFQLLANNAKSTLSVAVSSNTQATLTLQSGHGARFPNPQAPDYFRVTLDDGTNVEVCVCIANASDVLTVVRGVEGTTAQSSFATGTKVELRLTRDTILDLMRTGLFTRFLLRPVANVASYSNIGTVLQTLVGSAQAATLTNSSWREQCARVRHTSPNSAQNPTGWRVAQPTVNIANGFRFAQRFGFASVPNSSHWFVGLVNTTGAVNSVHPPSSLTQGIVIGWANGGTAPNLSIWRNDGSGNAVQLDCGSYFTANTQAWYEFGLFAQPNDTQVAYLVQRLDVSSIADVTGVFTSDLPGNSLWLSPFWHGASMVTSALAIENGGTAWDT